MDGAFTPAVAAALAAHRSRTTASESMKPERPQKTRLALNKKPKPLPPVHAKGTNSRPVRMEPDVNPQDEKQHRKNVPRRSLHVPREDADGPAPTSFKPLCPAKPSPSFLELPSSQWKPSQGLPYSQANRLGKGKRHFSPDHQPQECFGLLECMHNNLQTQTQIAQAQLSLLEDMRESINILLSRQERKKPDQPETHPPPKGSSSSPSPGS
ncbi:TSSK6-activating co-chaperone protein isoform X2 [Sceloporus undulatus]|uniref:TSSK6-activating co-chaperone protein isoform X2 n=1 Tax=Sceloporus undulatus TaxID=8520 RepID=UPI001C4C36DA|nr:TSSK6-activating co-chaperone protein isoform X2 [Sceloporus undulatus]